MDYRGKAETRREAVRYGYRCFISCEQNSRPGSVSAVGDAETDKIISGKATIVTEIETDHIEQWYLPMVSLQQLASTIAIEKVTQEQIDHLKQLSDVFFARVRSQADPMELLQADRAFHDIS